jgi:HAD superfamily hydrolase (TIGR01509 family)
MNDTRPVKPDVLLFDIGGVLVDYVGPERLSALLGGDPSPEDVLRRWPDCVSLARFETGELGIEDFAAAFVAEWGLPLTPASFLEEFAGWPRAPFPGALALLERLRGRAKLACLTNINELSWARVRDVMGLERCFDRCFASHEIGLLKPDPRIYAHVVEALGCDPARIAFFDDTQRNVAAAVAAGMRGYHVRGLAALETALASALAGPV